MMSYTTSYKTSFFKSSFVCLITHFQLIVPNCVDNNLHTYTSFSSSSLATSPLSIFFLKYSGHLLTSSDGKNVRLGPFCFSKSRVRQWSTAFAASIPEVVTPATPWLKVLAPHRYKPSNSVRGEKAQGPTCDGLFSMPYRLPRVAFR